MFEQSQFRELLERETSSTAGQSGLRFYNAAVVDYLQRLASENEVILMETELRKAQGSRRGIPEALVSARLLVKEASRVASAAGRDTLQVEDMQVAYRAKFCQVWPFCK